MSKKTTKLPDELIQVSERPETQQADRITQLGLVINVDLAGTLDDLKRDAVDDESKSAVLDARRGLRFMEIRGRMKDVAGGFTGWLEHEGIAMQRAYEAIKIANLLLSVPDGTSKKLVNLGNSKLIALARLPIETIEDAAASGELDEVDEMSVRELKAYARKMENRAVNAEEEMSQQQEKNKLLISQRDQALPQTEFPDFVTVIRHESHALSQKALLCIDSLEQMLDEHMVMLNAGGKSKEWHKGSAIAISSLYLQVQNIAARSASLTLRMRCQLETDNFDAQSVELRFNASEIEAARKDYDLMVLQHKTEQGSRIIERERAKPKKPGRPVGSTTKNKVKGKR